MQEKLLQFIDSLTLEQKDKDYLKLLIKEESGSLLQNVVDYVRKEQEELRITNYKLQEENLSNLSNLSNMVKEETVVAAASVVNVSQSVDEGVENLDKALDYGDDVGEKAEETYDKVILSLKKNDKWLSKLIAKVEKSNQDIKDKFVQLLQKAREQLAVIRKGMDGSWQEFDAKKQEADRTLGAQVASVRDEFKGDDHELEQNIIDFIEKLGSQYRDKIDNMSKAFSNNLDSAAKRIDNLTNETSDAMRDIINEREQAKLRDKIMEGK